MLICRRIAFWSFIGIEEEGLSKCTYWTSRVRMKTDRSSRIRFADLQGQCFKGRISKRNSWKLPSFQIFCACSPSLPCVARVCSSSLFLFVWLAAMVTRCVRVAGTIVVSVCWSSFSTFVSHWLYYGIHKWDSPTRCIACVLQHMGKHNLQVVHFLQILW